MGRDYSAAWILGDGYHWDPRWKLATTHFQVTYSTILTGTPILQTLLTLLKQVTIYQYSLLAVMVVCCISFTNMPIKDFEVVLCSFCNSELPGPKGTKSVSELEGTSWVIWSNDPAMASLFGVSYTHLVMGSLLLQSIIMWGHWLIEISCLNKPKSGSCWSCFRPMEPHCSLCHNGSLLPWRWHTVHPSLHL